MYIVHVEFIENGGMANMIKENVCTPNMLASTHAVNRPQESAHIKRLRLGNTLVKLLLINYACCPFALAIPSY